MNQIQVVSIMLLKVDQISLSFIEQFHCDQIKFSILLLDLPPFFVCICSIMFLLHQMHTALCCEGSNLFDHSFFK